MGLIHRIEDTLDRLLLRNILEVLLPYAEWKMTLKFVFQYDNDSKHNQISNELILLKINFKF